MADQGAEGLLSPWLREKRIGVAKSFLQGDIIDYGCGAGALAPYCDVDSYIGIDIDIEVIAIAKKLNPGFIFQSDFPDNRLYDVIVSLAVIEHVNDPENLLKKFKSVLKNDGKIVLTTPTPSVDWIHDVGSKLGLFSSHANEEHEQLIDYKSMNVYASNVGLKVDNYKKFLFGANQLFVLKMNP